MEMMSLVSHTAKGLNIFLLLSIFLPVLQDLDKGRISYSYILTISETISKKILKAFILYSHVSFADHLENNVTYYCFFSCQLPASQASLYLEGLPINSNSLLPAFKNVLNNKLGPK